MKRRDFLLSAAAVWWLVPEKAIAAQSLNFDEMYEGNPILGLQFSEKLQSLKNQIIQIQGFMAPPLKAEAKFLVMTREPVSLCPFCNSDQDWPDNIIVVYLDEKQEFVQPNRPIVVTGRLELGSYTDEETGFVSLVRLKEASFEVLK